MAPPEPMSARTNVYQLLGAVLLVVGFQVAGPRLEAQDSLPEAEIEPSLPEPDTILELGLEIDFVAVERLLNTAQNSENDTTDSIAASDSEPAENAGVERVVSPLDDPPVTEDDEIAFASALCCTTGQARVRAYTTPAFDGFTRQLDSEAAAYLDTLYTGGVVVFSPYWDNKLDLFDDATAYIDLYAIYPSSLAANDDVVLRDPAGNRLFIPWGCSGGTCPQYAADVGNPTYRDRLSERVEVLVNAGYRRVLLDDVNMHMSIGDGNGNRVAPIDPRTGAEMTLADWRRYVAETVELLAENHPGIAFEHNGVWFVDSPTFDDPFVDRQIAAADVVHLERGASDQGLTGGSDRFSLENLMRFAERVHRLGSSVFYYHQSPDNTASHELNLAVYLLTNTGQDFVGSNDVTHIGAGSFWDGYHVDLGDAEGARSADNGLHERHFTDGVVYVLEPDAASRTVTLDRPQFTPSGDLVTSIDLAPGTGRVLTDTCDTGCP